MRCSFALDWGSCEKIGRGAELVYRVCSILVVLLDLVLALESVAVAQNELDRSRWSVRSAVSKVLLGDQQGEGVLALCDLDPSVVRSSEPGDLLKRERGKW